MRRSSDPPSLPPPPLPTNAPPPTRKAPQIGIRPQNSFPSPRSVQGNVGEWRFGVENAQSSKRDFGQICVGFLVPKINNGQISKVEELLNLKLLDLSNHLNVVCQSAVPRRGVKFFETTRNHSVDFSRLHVFPNDCRYEIQTVERGLEAQNVKDVCVHSFLMRSTDASLTTTYCTCIKWKRKCENLFLTKLIPDNPKVNFRNVLYEPVAVVVFTTKPRYRSFQGLLSRLPVDIMFGKGRTNYACTTESLRLVLHALLGCDSLGHAIAACHAFKRTFPKIVNATFYTGLFEPLMWYLERKAVSIATGGHVWTERCTENKLRQHFDINEINSCTVHCRMCKLERVDGYLKTAFKGFASKNYFLGEFSGSPLAPLPLTPTSLTSSSYDLCSSPKLSDSFLSMHAAEGGNNNSRGGRSSFFSKVVGVGSNMHRRMSSRVHQNIDTLNNTSEYRLRKRISSRSTDASMVMSSENASSSGRHLRHRTTSSQSHFRSRVSSSMTSRDSMGPFKSNFSATKYPNTNPGVGYYIWSVVCKLDSTSRASASQIPGDIFSRLVISQTVPRICAYLILSEIKEEEKKKRKVFPKRTSIVLDAIDTSSPASSSSIRCNMCLPLTDLPYTRVFEAVPPSAIISIFSAILCDAKVVVLSRYEWRLNDVLEVVLSLTYPLHTMTSLPVYQPILHFDDWKVMSESPYNFVFGSLIQDHNTALGESRRLSRWNENEAPSREFCETYPSTFIVDLDVMDVDVMETHLAKEFEKTGVPCLPEKYRNRLMRAFDAAYSWPAPKHYSSRRNSALQSKSRSSSAARGRVDSRNSVDFESSDSSPTFGTKNRKKIKKRSSSCSTAEYVTRDVCSTDEESANVFYRPLFEREVVPITSELGCAIENANYVSSPRVTPKSSDSGKSSTSRGFKCSPVSDDRKSPRFADRKSSQNVDFRMENIMESEEMRDEKKAVESSIGLEEIEENVLGAADEDVPMVVRMRTQLSRKFIFEEDLAEEAALHRSFDGSKPRRRSSLLKARRNKPSLKSRIRNTRNAVKIVSGVLSQNTNKIDYVTSNLSAFRGSYAREMFIRHAFASVLASLTKEVRCYMSNGDKEEAQRYAAVENFEFSKLLNKDKWLGSDTTNPFSKRPAEREFCSRLYDSMAFQIDIRTRAISNRRDVFDRWCRRKLESILAKLRNVKANRSLLVTSSSIQSRENGGIPLDGLKGYLWKLPRGVDPWSKTSMFSVGRGYRWKRVWCEIDVIENRDRGKVVWYKEGNGEMEKTFIEYQRFLYERNGESAWTSLAVKRLEYLQKVEKGLFTVHSRIDFERKMNALRKKYFRAHFHIVKGRTSVTIPVLDEVKKESMKTPLKTAYPFKVTCNIAENKEKSMFLCAPTEIERDRWIRVLTAFDYQDDLSTQMKLLFTQTGPEQTWMKDRIQEFMSQIRINVASKHKLFMRNSRRLSADRMKAKKRGSIHNTIDTMRGFETGNYVFSS